MLYELLFVVLGIFPFFIFYIITSSIAEDNYATIKQNNISRRSREEAQILEDAQFLSISRIQHDEKMLLEQAINASLDDMHTAEAIRQSLSK